MSVTIWARSLDLLLLILPVDINEDVYISNKYYTSFSFCLNLNDSMMLQDGENQQ